MILVYIVDIHTPLKFNVVYLKISPSKKEIPALEIINFNFHVKLWGVYIDRQRQCKPVVSLFQLFPTDHKEFSPWLSIIRFGFSRPKLFPGCDQHNLEKMSLADLHISNIV